MKIILGIITYALICGTILCIMKGGHENDDT